MISTYKSTGFKGDVHNKADLYTAIHISMVKKRVLSDEICIPQEFERI